MKKIIIVLVASVSLIFAATFGYVALDNKKEISKSEVSQYFSLQVTTRDYSHTPSYVVPGYTSIPSCYSYLYSSTFNTNCSSYYNPTYRYVESITIQPTMTITITKNRLSVDYGDIFLKINITGKFTSDSGTEDKVLTYVINLAKTHVTTKTFNFKDDSQVSKYKSSKITKATIAKVYGYVTNKK